MVIHFVGNISNQYGRGKDKAKRKSRVGTLTGAAGGLASGLLAGKTLTSGAVGALAGAGTGMLVDRSINKEKERYKKEGARTRFGKVINDAKVGAKSVGGTLGGLTGASIIGGTVKNGGGSLKKRLLIGAGLGALGGGSIAGLTGLAGGTVGAGVGLARGLLQSNKKKKKK